MPGVAVVVAECIAFGHGDDFRSQHACGGGIRMAGYSAAVEPTGGDGQRIGGEFVVSVPPLMKVERLRHPGGPFGVKADGAGHVSDGENVFAHGDLPGVAVGVDVVVFGYGGVVFDVGESVRGGDDDAGIGFPQRDGGPLIDARPRGAPA